MTVLGVDVGGTKVAFRAEREDGAPYETSFRWPSPGGRGRATCAADLAALAAGVAELRGRWKRPIASVGVAVPAAVDRAGRVVTWPNRPSWAGLDLRAALRGLFPDAEVRWGDDGDLAALAEARAAEAGNVVYVGVGTGIGGGVLVDGRPLPGPGRGSCEVGHMVLDRAGPRCACGRRGCVQALASGPATLRRAARLRGREAAFAELAEAFASGEEWAVGAVRESAAAVAAAVVGVGELLALDLAVVGGGFAHGVPGFVDEVASEAAALRRTGRDLTVRPAALGGLSSLRGALILAAGD